MYEFKVYDNYACFGDVYLKKRDCRNRVWEINDARCRARRPMRDFAV